MALIQNFIVDQGSDFSAIFYLKDAEGLPLNISGQSFRSKFQKTYTSATSVSFVCTPVGSGSLGTLEISVPAATTINVTPGRYVYDVEMYSSSSIQRIREGVIEVTPSVTSSGAEPIATPYRLSGVGSPEGAVSAPPGYSYVDSANGTLYFKLTGTDAYGWQAFVQL